MYFSDYSSPLGKMYMISDGEKLYALVFDGQKYFDFDQARLKRNDRLEIFNMVKSFLDDYFNGKECHFEDSLLELEGTSFQKEVWQILLSIDYGKTVTYKDIALQMAQSRKIKHMSSQAVGGAVGKNPIAIIVPCHRVLGQNKKLVGYAGGIDKKAALLKIEGVLKN